MAIDIEKLVWEVGDKLDLVYDKFMDGRFEGSEAEVAAELQAMKGALIKIMSKSGRKL